jgi:hypothetical protein
MVDSPEKELLDSRVIKFVISQTATISNYTVSRDPDSVGLQTPNHLQVHPVGGRASVQRFPRPT